MENPSEGKIDMINNLMGELIKFTKEKREAYFNELNKQSAGCAEKVSLVLNMYQ